MKNVPIWAWILIVIVVILIIVVVFMAFKSPSADAPGTPNINPTPAPGLLGQAAGILGSLPIGTWLSNLFGNNNNQTSNGNGCAAGGPSAGDQCIDQCGFPLTSDQNPACF